MIKIDKIDTYGWEAAIRGMRNPMNSWKKSDSLFNGNRTVTIGKTKYRATGLQMIGPNDLDLMQRLFKAGPEHRKYLRMIHASMDILAPLYWWKEFDTYKIGTVANSCSTMHKIAAKPFEIGDFSVEHLDYDDYEFFKELIQRLESDRQLYNECKDNDSMKKAFWWNMIQSLPTSYNQLRTVDMNYETVFSIIRQRKGHKLDEWNNFVDILSDLPYVREISGDAYGPLYKFLTNDEDKNET